MPATSTPAGQPGTVPESEIHTIATQVEKWRFKCPRYRHDDWRLWDGVFSCRTCENLRNAGEIDVDPIYDELWDDKEKQLVPRERIRVRVRSAL